MSDAAGEPFARVHPGGFVGWRVGAALRERYPELALFEGVAEGFDLDAFALAGLCERAPEEGEHLELHGRWNAPFLSPEEGEWNAAWGPPEPSRAQGDGSVSRRSVNALYRAQWEGESLRVCVAQWCEGTCNTARVFVLARELSVAERFYVAVCRFANKPRREVLVVNGDWWRSDAQLFDAIEKSSFEQLLLPAALRDELLADFDTFLASRERYASLGLPWKRGVLFLGPPGNGKTHTLRALLHRLALPVVYVQSFRSKFDTDERNIDRVFDRARRVAPCVLVFEDLDAQLTEHNRSFFLNQLDGFAPNAGLLVLATTNHPERLDPAILERPSRFDRKYHFGLPDELLRAVYLARWFARVDAQERPTEPQLAALAAATEGFSFAYLQELGLSALLRWLQHPTQGTLAALALGQLEVLRAQMRSDETARSKPTPTEENA